MNHILRLGLHIGINHILDPTKTTCTLKFHCFCVKMLIICHIYIVMGKKIITILR